MSGKHLCQSRLSATYISSNRYMHIILFYFRLFILFSPGLPFIRPSSVFLRSSSGPPSLFLRPSFVLPSSFIRPSFSLSTVLSLLPPRHSLYSLPIISTAFSPSFPARPGIPVLSTVLPLVSPTGFSPSFPMFTLSTIPFAPPVIPALVSVIPGSTGNPLPS